MKAIGLKTFLVLLIISFFLFFLDGKDYLNGAKSTIQLITLPVQYSLYTTQQNAKNTFSFLTFWKSGESRIKYLELRIMEFAAAKNEAARLQKENDELRKQLGVSPLRSHTLLPAVVLGGGRFLQIGAGSSDGVKMGMTVVYLDNLIGKINMTTAHSSFVILPTDPNSKIPVKAGASRGIVSGQFNSSEILDRIAQNEEIKTGDTILTSGEGDSFEPNLVVGKVEKIISLETDIFKKATVAPAIKFSELTSVFILLD